MWLVQVPVPRPEGWLPGACEAHILLAWPHLRCSASIIWLWVQNRVAPKWIPGKWNQGLKPAVFCWLNFDPYRFGWSQKDAHMHNHTFQFVNQVALKRPPVMCPACSEVLPSMLDSIFFPGRRWASGKSQVL